MVCDTHGTVKARMYSESFWFPINANTQHCQLINGVFSFHNERFLDKSKISNFFWYNVLQLLVKIYHSQFLQFLQFLSFCSDGTWAQQDCDNEHKRDGMLIKMETQLQFVIKAAIVQKLII